MWKNKRVGELVLVLSGFVLGASLLGIVLTQGFFLWIAAKVLYGIGVVLFVFNK